VAAKAWVALVISVLVGGLTAAQGAAGDGLDIEEWLVIGLAVLNPIFVWSTANQPEQAAVAGPPAGPPA
jgi:hypothetical protein